MPPTFTVISSDDQKPTIYRAFRSLCALSKRSDWLPFVIFFLLFFGKNKIVLAQDMRLGQFYKAPQLLNPALTGVFKGSFRAHLNYRDQWSSVLGSNPFRTENIGIDIRRNSFGNDFFGLGLNAYLDGAGNGHFEQTRVHASGSYAKQVDGSGYGGRSQFLILGGQIGFGQNTIDWNRLWFSDQFDNVTGYPAYDTPSTEQFLNEAAGTTEMFLDINAGLLWYLTLADSKSMYFGFAMNHINSPEISLFTSEETLDWRYVVHAGGEFPVGNNLSLLPAMIFQKQGDRSSFALGTNLRYAGNDRNEMAIRLGAWPHFSSKTEEQLVLDEWTTSLILEWSKIDIGMSYGINTSSLNNATLSRGAFELSMTYVVANKSRSELKCPKF